MGLTITDGGFLACFFLALRRYGYAGLSRVGLLAVVATFVFGILEALIRLRISASLPETVVSLVLLSIADTGQYLGLAGAGVCAGAAMLARGGLLGRLGGIICVAAAFMITVGLNFFSAQAALNIGLSIVSVVILFYAAAAAMRSVPSAGDRCRRGHLDPCGKLHGCDSC